MPQDSDDDGSAQLPTLPAPGGWSVAQALEGAFGADEPLAFIQQALDSEALAADQRLALESLGNFCLGLAATQQQDFGTARPYFAAAAQGLSGLSGAGIDELRALAVGLVLYSDAIGAIRGKNVGLTRDLLAQTEDHLRRAGKFGQQFEYLIDRIRPEARFVEALDALMGLDFARAQVLVEQSYQAAVKVATRYCKEDTPEQSFWKAYSHYFKAVYALQRASLDFVQFNYDNLVLETNLDRDALQARDLFAEADTNLPIAKNLINMNDGNLELLSMYTRLAPMMQRVFNGTFKPDPQSFDAIRGGIRKAVGCFSKVGTDAAGQLRMCESLLDRINNLERLTRPKPVADPVRPRPRGPRQRRSPN